MTGTSHKAVLLFSFLLFIIVEMFIDRDPKLLISFLWGWRLCKEFKRYNVPLVVQSLCLKPKLQCVHHVLSKVTLIAEMIAVTWWGADVDTATNFFIKPTRTILRPKHYPDQACLKRPAKIFWLLFTLTISLYCADINCSDNTHAKLRLRIHF